MNFWILYILDSSQTMHESGKLQKGFSLEQIRRLAFFLLLLTKSSLFPPFSPEVYADPDHSSYEALKFVSGVFSTFTPKVCKLLHFVCTV